MDPSDGSPRSIASQLTDWILAAIVIATSLALLNVNPDSHDFSIADLSLSYAHRETPKIPLWLLVVLAVVAPAGVITISTLQSKESSLQSRLHKLNHGLLGLGISLGSATVILNIKNLAGKPRPDFLATCQPDLNNIERHTVGGYGQGIYVMVNRGICQQADHAWLNDAFRSFPSGYATVAFGSLCYTSMYLSQRFRLPLFTIRNPARRNREYSSTGEVVEPLLGPDPMGANPEPSLSPCPVVLPVYYLFIPYIPIGLAIFIAGTRYFDFRNHGIDVIAGAIGGIFSAYVGMKWTSPSTLS